MIKEKQSGCAEMKFQSAERVREDSLLMEYFFLESIYELK